MTDKIIKVIDNKPKIIGNQIVLTVAPGGFQGAPGVTPIPFGAFSMNTPVNGDITLDPYFFSPLKVLGIYALKVLSGSIDLTFQINGVNITGLTNIVANTSPQNINATGANQILVGNNLHLILSNASSPAPGKLEFAMLLST